jgi:hypothetical protein
MNPHTFTLLLECFRHWKSRRDYSTAITVLAFPAQAKDAVDTGLVKPHGAEIPRKPVWYRMCPKAEPIMIAWEREGVLTIANHEVYYNETDAPLLQKIVQRFLT